MSVSDIITQFVSYLEQLFAIIRDFFANFAKPEDNGENKEEDNE